MAQCFVAQCFAQSGRGSGVLNRRRSEDEMHDDVALV
jgi:hypothetical protein